MPKSLVAGSAGAEAGASENAGKGAGLDSMEAADSTLVERAGASVKRDGMPGMFLLFECLRARVRSMRFCWLQARQLRLAMRCPF